MSRVVTYLKRQRAAWLLADFWRFATVTGILYSLEEQPHREMMAEAFACVPDFKGGRQRRKLYLAPRYTYKTSIAIALIVYMILRFPNISIIIYRASRALSKDMLDKIKNILTTNAEILSTFGDLSVGAGTWASFKITINTRTIPKVDPTISVWGLKTGAAGSHPDFVLCDDIVTETNCDSIVDMEKAYNVVTATFPLLPKWGSLLITGTEWSAISPYTKIRDQNTEAREAGKEPDFEEYIRTVYVRDENDEIKLFFPREITEAFLERQRDSTPARWYASWYFQETRELGLRHFPRNKIKLFDGEYNRGPYQSLYVAEMGPDPFPVYTTMVLDPALTGYTSSDNFGIVVPAFDTQGWWWILEAQEWRKLPTDAGDEIIKLLTKYEPKVFLIESQQADAEMVARIGRFIRDAQMECMVRSYSALQDEDQGRRGKAQRIEALEPLVRAEKIRFRRGMCSPVIRELDNYPSLKKDDCLDALSMARKLAKNAPRLAAIPLQDDDREPRDLFHERIDAISGPPRLAGVLNGAWTGPYSQRLRREG